MFEDHYHMITLLVGQKISSNFYGSKPHIFVGFQSHGPLNGSTLPQATSDKAGLKLRQNLCILRIQLIDRGLTWVIQLFPEATNLSMFKPSGKQ